MSDAASHIAAYLEYNAIVGNADGGVMLSELEFEEFKQKMVESRKNRLYVCWRDEFGVDCKNIGPQSKCFCQHRFREHATDNVSDRNVHCRVKGCKCRLFCYIPVHGNQDFKCHCKHSASVHSVFGQKQCQKQGCLCAGFSSSFACSCGNVFPTHTTVFETRDERIASGRPVDNLAMGGAGYEAMGGITNFSSLVDGVDRLPDGYLANHEFASLETPPLASRALVSNSAETRVSVSQPFVARPASQVPQDKQETVSVSAASFDPNIVVVDGMFLPRSGKMTAEQEFSVYEQKYKSKPSRVLNSSTPHTPGLSSASVPPALARVNHTTPSLSPSLSSLPAPTSNDSPTTNISSSLQLLKRRMKIPNDSVASSRELPSQAASSESPLCSSECVSIDASIEAVELALKQVGLTASKQFALKKQLQMHRAARIRENRKAEM